ncbi:MAG: hypothetical protein QI199_04625 [Candidatus Korarchaeota archaeon]|nr:hypothetical protein [Candidatus Korarchaeota archaeon]
MTSGKIPPIPLDLTLELRFSRAIRRALGIRKGGVVRAKIEEGKLIVEPVPALEDI